MALAKVVEWWEDGKLRGLLHLHLIWTADASIENKEVRLSHVQSMDGIKLSLSEKEAIAQAAQKFAERTGKLD